jgi:hypothetical protein
MNSTIQELTAALQELTVREAKEIGAAGRTLPGKVDANELAPLPEIEAFLETRREYAVKTRHVSVGMY